MAESLVVKVLRAFQEKVAAGEEEQFAAMARRWLGVENRLEGQMSALALEIERAKQAGKTLSMEQVRRMDRYQALLAQTRAEVGKYEKYATELIGGKQKELVRTGWEAAVEAVKAARPNDWQEFISRLPVKAVENMIGLAGDGSPLAELLKEASLRGAVGIDQALIDAMALGWNPAKTARAMADGLAGGLDRALLIARTEQMRAYRESTRMGYQVSGIVTQYKRMASLSDRTCVACLLADGTIYDVMSDFEEHPDGRCTLVPIIRGLEEPSWQTGQEWILKQDEATQRGIMGGLFEPWKNGQISLEQMVTRHDDATWGAYLKPTPVSSLGLQ